MAALFVSCSQGAMIPAPFTLRKKEAWPHQPPDPVTADMAAVPASPSEKESGQST